jgi:group I intron endonuclease
MSSTTRIYTVYQILNKINHKVYIGATIRPPKERWRKHLNWHTKRNYALYQAMREYGPHNFEFSILEHTDSQESLNELESKYIQEYNSYFFQENSRGYNMTLGGSGSHGNKLSDEAKRKLSDALSGSNNYWYGKGGTCNPMWGKTHSTEVRRRLSEANMGTNNPMWGKTHSEETKKKIAESLISRNRNKKNG